MLLAARELRARGIGAVLVSLGAGGALLVDRSGEYHARTLRSPCSARWAPVTPPWPGSWPRAGGPDALRHAVAYGAAACRLPGSATPGPADIRIDDVELAPTPDVTLALTGDAA